MKSEIEAVISEGLKQTDAEACGEVHTFERILFF